MPVVVVVGRHTLQAVLEVEAHHLAVYQKHLVEHHTRQERP